MTHGRTNRYLQMNWLSLRINQLKFETLGQSLIILRESMEYHNIIQLTLCARWGWD